MHTLDLHIVSRAMGSAAFALITTLALFFLMKSLIATTDVDVDEEEAIRIVDFIRVPEERKPVDTIEHPTEPEPPQELPPMPEVILGDGSVGIIDTGIDFEPEPQGPTVGGGLSDGTHLPLVKVQPNYPRNALSRGIEGYVIVEFDVAPDGSVRNPRVIENHPNSIFDRAALQAAEKFRYKPKIVGGTPVPVHGVQNRFVFELERG